MASSKSVDIPPYWSSGHRAGFNSGTRLAAATPALNGPPSSGRRLSHLGDHARKRCDLVLGPFVAVRESADGAAGRKSPAVLSSVQYAVDRRPADLEGHGESLQLPHPGRVY